MTPLLALFLFGTPPTATPSPDALVTGRDIDRACDLAKKFGDKHQSQIQVVADVSAGVLPKKGQGTWKLFKTPQDMGGAGQEGAAPNTQARVWSASSGVTYVDAFFQSASGDRGQFVEYCYRPDGTLARTAATFNTFEADGGAGVTRLRARHYGTTGEAIDTREKVLNLKTKRPAPKARFDDEPEPLFLKKDDLPFWSFVARS